jgi:hypothetical protein
MPKIKKPSPYFMKHLVDRFREGRISDHDFDELQDGLNSNSEVPLGKWYKKFPNSFWQAKDQCRKYFLHRAWFPMARKFSNEKQRCLLQVPLFPTTPRRREEAGR